MTSNVDNVTNLLSEHDRVTLNLNTKESRMKPQFEERRNYQEVTYSNLMNELDERKILKFKKYSRQQIQMKYLRYILKNEKSYRKIFKNNKN